MIRFFVSSTFGDMEAERDTIYQQVLPAVRSYLYDYYGMTVVSMEDLRWGISTEELESDSGMKRILSVCMKEIDYCFPYIIILLGERYGSVPSREIIDAFGEDAEIGTFSQNELVGKSVTEMEIIRYLMNLRRSGIDKSNLPMFICMRNPLPYHQMLPEDQLLYQSIQPEDIGKIRKLRQYLLDHFPEYVIHYSAHWDQSGRCVSGLESFAIELKDRIIRTLKKQLPPKPATEEELQLSLDESFEEGLLLVTAPRYEYIDSIQTSINCDFRTIILRGTSGGGKSCIISQFVNILRKQDDVRVISMHCGNGRFMKNCHDILHNLVWRLKTLMGEGVSFPQGRYSYEELKETAYNLLTEASKTKKTVVVIDALNMLQSDDHLKMLDFVPAQGIENCCFVLTASDEFSFPDIIIDDIKTNVIAVSSLADNEVVSIIQQQLAGQHKQLPSYAVSAIQEAAVFRTPLYLSFLIQRIDMMDAEEYRQALQNIGENCNREEALYRYVQNLILTIPDNEEELAWHLFASASTKLHFDQYEAFLTITSVLQYGFRPQDYVACSREKSYSMGLLDITLFIRYLPFMFSMDSEGRIRFSHRLIERSVKKHTKSMAGNFLKDLLFHINQLDELDPVKYTELFHLFLCSESFHISLDTSIIIQYISDSYLSSEQDSLHTDKKHDARKQKNTYEKIIEAVQSIYIHDPQKQNAVFRLLSSLCKEAAGMAHQTLYGFLSAILFSFDTLFGPEVEKELINGLMKCMYSLCISDLYPYVKENPLYLRCIYVCCEQCGIRSTSFEEQDFYYHAFYQYASSMGQFNDLPERVLTEWNHDMAVCHQHLANSYEQMDYRRALAHYEEAYGFLESCRDASIFDPDRHLYIEKCIQENNAAMANVVIQEAKLNHSIGFDPGDGFWSMLEQSYFKMVNAIKFFELNDEMNHRSFTLARYWAILNDYYIIKDKPDMQRICIENQIHYARAEFEKSRNILALDQWRNGLLRAALSNQCNYSLAEKTEFINRSYTLIEQLKFSYTNADPQVIRQILSVTLQSMVDLYEQRISSIQNDDIPNAQNRDDIKELCLYVIGTVSNYMHELFKGDNGENAFNKLMKLLHLASNLKSQYINEVLQIIRQSEYDKFLDATRYSESAFKLGKAVIPYQETPSAYENLIAIAYWCSVAFHNLHSWSYMEYQKKNNINNADTEAWKKESYYQEMMLVYDKLLRSIGKYSSETLLNYVQQTEKEQRLNSFTSPASWIQFCFHCIQNNKTGFLWKICDEINYAIPGQKYCYLYLIQKEYSFDQELTKIMPTIGRYLIEHLKEEKVLHLLAKSDLFEAITLEEAYKIGDHEAAITILDNQYDNYLELPLLFILRKYDRREFLIRFKELKPICVSKRKKEIRDHEEVLSPLFCEEFRRIAKSSK